MADAATATAVPAAMGVAGLTAARFPNGLADVDCTVAAEAEFVTAVDGNIFAVADNEDLVAAVSGVLAVGGVDLDAAV
jgi:hypothetical protein